MEMKIVDRANPEFSHSLEIKSWRQGIDLKRNLLQKLDFSYARHRQLYVHVPFCFFHCTFCVYKGELLRGRKVVDLFMDDIEYEIQQTSGYFAHQQFHAIFFGGGTVSTLDVGQLEKLLGIMRLNFYTHYSNDHEFTVEMAPHAFTDAKMQVLRDYQVNRITLGLQSLDPLLLKKMSRPALPLRQIESILKKAGQVAIDVNVDLMTGIEGRTYENLKADFDYLNALGCNSIMVYVDMNQYRLGENSRLREDGVDQVVKLAQYVENEFQLNYGSGINEYNRFIRKGSKALEFTHRYTTDREDRSYLCVGLGPGAQSMTREYIFGYST